MVEKWRSVEAIFRVGMGEVCTFSPKQNSSNFWNDLWLSEPRLVPSQRPRSLRVGQIEKCWREFEERNERQTTNHYRISLNIFGGIYSPFPVVCCDFEATGTRMVEQLRSVGVTYRTRGGRCKWFRLGILLEQWRKHLILALHLLLVVLTVCEHAWLGN